MTEQIDNLFTTGGKSSQCTAESLTQRSGINIYTSVSLIQLAYAMTSGTYHTGRVGFIHHYQRIVFLGKITNLIHRSYVAIH